MTHVYGPKDPEYVWVAWYTSIPACDGLWVNRSLDSKTGEDQLSLPSGLSPPKLGLWTSQITSPCTVGVALKSWSGDDCKVWHSRNNTPGPRHVTSYEWS